MRSRACVLLVVCLVFLGTWYLVEGFAIGENFQRRTGGLMKTIGSAHGAEGFCSFVNRGGGGGREGEVGGGQMARVRPLKNE